ncbi:MAG TPA: Fe(3+) ABC transporter substrate-binding protein, partial [Burkholderiales bacterium]|nr:Fe(3+) ABC transporter substrate-binding protein [Burkholderiales bacterium]
MTAFIQKIFTAACLCAAASTGLSQERVLNLYSSRHYQTDEALYSNFTR